MGSSGFDGSIKIDSRVDTKGFNAGVASMGRSMSTLGLRLLVTLAQATLAIAVMSAIVGALVSVIISLGRAAIIFGTQMWQMLTSSISQTDAFYASITQLQGAFNNVKGAFVAAFATLLQAALPVIMTVINWLVQLINWISMVIAALMGQKTVMQYVAGSAEAAAGSTGKVAKNTEKAKKAAQGALAAFDEINVLAKQTADEVAPDIGAGGAGGPAGGGMKMQEVPIDPTILAFVNKWEAFKKSWNDFWGMAGDIANMAWIIISTAAGIAWAWIKQAANDAWKWIQQAFTDGANWCANAVNAILLGFTNAWNLIVLLAGIAWGIISGLWGIAWNWFMANVITPLVTAWLNGWDHITAFAAACWSLIQAVWTLAWNWFLDFINRLGTAFQNGWDHIMKLVVAVWNGIKLIWGIAVKWFNDTFLDPINKAFGTTIDNISHAWMNGWRGIVTFIKDQINTIIGFINGLISGVIKGINGMISALNSVSFTIPNFVPNIGGQSFGLNINQITTPQIPLLATGAWIPPGAGAFAAILGDNRTQGEIVAPEDTLRRIVQEELANHKITIEFGGSLGELIRILRPHIIQEDRRVGSSLIIGASPS